MKFKRKQKIEEKPVEKFSPGRMVNVGNALLNLDDLDVYNAVTRHLSGDWGECGPSDWKQNNFSLENGGEIISVYRTRRRGKLFWVMTNAERSETKILLPEDS
jgi:hypothetical protein